MHALPNRQCHDDRSSFSWILGLRLGLSRGLDIPAIFPDKYPLTPDFPLHFPPQFLLYTSVLISWTENHPIGASVDFDASRHDLVKIEIDVQSRARSGCDSVILDCGC